MLQVYFGILLCLFIYFCAIIISVQKHYKKEKWKIITDNYQNWKKKPCLSLMNKFYSLVYVRRFYAQNSKKRKKEKKTSSFQLFGKRANITKHFEILTSQLNINIS